MSGIGPDESTVTHQRLTLVTMAVSSFALPLMLSAVNVALPEIARTLRMDAVTLSWVQLMFLTASAAAVLAFGRLADLVGHVRVFAWGILTLLVSSLLGAAAPTAEWLLCARAIQGLSAAMIYSTHIAIITSVYPPAQRGRAIGMLVSAVYFGLTCGPLLGGWLVETWGWRAAFLAHLPLGLGVLLIGVPRLHREQQVPARGRFDGWGAGIYASGIVLLMWGGASLPGPLGVLAVVAGFAAMGAFMRHQRRHPEPLLDVNLFYTNRVFALSSLASLLMYATTYSTLVLVSLYLQYLKGLDPLEAGTIMLAQPCVSAILSPLAGRLSDHAEPRVIASCGIAVTALGLWLLSGLGPDSALWQVVACLIATGLGFSLFSSPNVNAIMSGVARSQYGTAGGVVATMRILGQLASMGLVAIVFALTLGRVEIGPDTYPQLAHALTVSFLLAAGGCVLALLCSLSRGRLHPESRTS